MIKLSCKICGNGFNIHPYRKDSAKFCSNICRIIALKGHPAPKSAFKKGNHPSTEFKKGMIPANFRGRSIHSKGYVYIYKPNHPFADRHKNVLEHRLVIEKQIERYLSPEEVPHHLGKKDDNRPHMLMAFVSQSVHMRFHKNPNNVKPKEIIFDGRTPLS